MEVLQAFLSEPRRVTLVRRLTANGQPIANARRLANAPHDLRVLDGLLSAVIERLTQHVEDLADATQRGNVIQQDSAARRLQTDFAVFQVYTAEIVARKLPRDLFPRTEAAITGRKAKP